MNISYNWLKRYIDTDLGAEEVARILTDIGLEVEGFEKIETIKGGLAGVVVGEVLTCEDHPDSDHLHVTTVDVGTGEPLQIVCGAPNCRAGLKVLCATVGTVLYPGGGDEEFKIKRSKIRGVESLGMLCAEDELGIGASHDGIMELPADAVAGTTARDYLRIEDDYLIEVGLTPNRVDAASHIGVARDLAAGQLVIACRAALPVRQSYWLVRPENQADTPAIATVCDWLRQLAKDTAGRIENEVLRDVRRLECTG